MRFRSSKLLITVDGVAGKYSMDGVTRLIDQERAASR